MRTTEYNCLNCRHKISAASEIFRDELVPKEGDITICFYCGEIMEFDADLKLQIIKDFSLTQLNAEELAALKKVKSFIKAKLN